MDSIEKEIFDLRALLNKWNKEYYIDSSPSIDDLMYDKILLKLQNLENKYPEYKSFDSPTLRLGSDLQNGFKEVEHIKPILSLEKVYDIQSLMSWINKVNSSNSLNFSMEPKIDGCSIVLYYKQGILELALTRGNGRFGNDVTENVRTVKHVPLYLNEKIDLVIRGEIYISKENFIGINKMLENPYTNARNLASGILRRIKSTEVAAFPLDIFAYDVLSSSLDFKANHDAITKLKELGLRVNPFIKFFDSNNLEQNINEYVLYLIEKRALFEYETDGIVLKVDDFNLRENLGYTYHHPKWAMAYKFEALRSISKVNSIVIQVGRSGKITPVAKIDRVLVSGAYISNVTLHNQDYINSLDLNIGDIVSISRRGDVIPAIEEVATKLSRGHYVIPANCPSCDYLLVSEGSHLFCVNQNCEMRKLEQIKYFCSKKCMHIEDLSEKTIEFLLKKKFISSEIDLYTFDFELLLEFEGFKNKKINNFKNAIKASKKRPFSRLLLSVGIKDLGENTIKLLIENNLNSFAKFEDLLKDKEVFKNKLLSIKGIGEKIVLNIIEAFQSEHIILKFKFFEKNGFNMEEAVKTNKADNKTFFYGKKFCITGSFEKFSRDKLIELLEKEGAVFIASISKNLDFLLVGDKAGFKLEKAKSFNIQIMNIQDIKKYLSI